MTIRRSANPPPSAAITPPDGDTPNVGNHSLPLPGERIRPPRCGRSCPAQHARLAGVSKVTGCPNPFAPEGALCEPIYTTDPGNGLLTGLRSAVNRIKGSVLRGLAARSPYFHNGAARKPELVGELLKPALSDESNRQRKAAADRVFPCSVEWERPVLKDQAGLSRSMARRLKSSLAR
jgi:hypothetical protein